MATAFRMASGAKTRTPFLVSGIKTFSRSKTSTWRSPKALEFQGPEHWQRLQFQEILMAAADPKVAAQTVRLVIADVDGTLVTQEKVLTARAVDAVSKLRDARIKFVVTSGRPPRGMAMLVEPLKLDEPLAAFNGGVLTQP